MTHRLFIFLLLGVFFLPSLSFSGDPSDKKPFQKVNGNKKTKKGKNSSKRKETHLSCEKRKKKLPKTHQSEKEPKGSKSYRRKNSSPYSQPLSTSIPHIVLKRQHYDFTAPLLSQEELISFFSN